jgi:hypothetical protein
MIEEKEAKREEARLVLRSKHEVVSLRFKPTKVWLRRSSTLDADRLQPTNGV